MVQIAVVGSGYVGLVSAACFAEVGNHVVCFDKDLDKVKKLQSGVCTIFEAGLEELLQKNIAASRLSFELQLEKLGTTQFDVIIIAVGTPLNPADGRADLSDLDAVFSSLSQFLCDDVAVVIKSTVPVGTGRRISGLILKENPRAKFSLFSNPEFLREGRAVQDFLYPDRIVVGTLDPVGADSAEIMRKLYLPWTNRQVPLQITGIETSELIKYTANCFLATRLAFINEIANLCEETGADIAEVAYGIGLDKRIGTDYLQAGPGYGGSCLPKDTMALVRTASDYNAPLTIVESVVKSNENRKQQMIDKIVNACGGEVNGKTVAILGIAFKANTIDIRDSSAIPIIEGLLQLGAYIKIYDPIVMQAFVLAHVIWCSDIHSVLHAADVAVIVTEWDEYRNLDLSLYVELLRPGLDNKATVVDLRNIYEPIDMFNAGINYFSIGRSHKLLELSQNIHDVKHYSKGVAELV